MYGRRIIVPRSLRREVLDSLHSAHQCPSKMIERAKQSVYWPGIMTDIEETRKSCSHCDRNAPSQSMMPPVMPASPDYPFQMIAIDYFDCKGKSWLVIADRFSGWLSLHYYPREATSTDLMQSLKNYFCRISNNFLILGDFVTVSVLHIFLTPTSGLKPQLNQEKECF